MSRLDSIRIALGGLLCGIGLHRGSLRIRGEKWVTTRYGLERGTRYVFACDRFGCAYQKDLTP